MTETDQPTFPEWACRGACNHAARQTWTAYHHTRDAYYRAVDAAVAAWTKAGKSGDACGGARVRASW
ncbi:hypothetical protein [Planotetraspora phitsanulokensis]|uniref:hypothetical protein n=1 Tax=Planotetraspora phitsanulokensis TaxID=575192 RepID=UPI001951F478|nr:hypothetical protein [Planotetraspora phitsanulokensis]